MTFSYRRYIVPDGSSRGERVSVYRPFVEVRVHGSEGHFDIRGLVDTGADFTILPLSLADLLGIDIDSGSHRIGQGVTGHTLKVSTGRVALELQMGREKYRWLAQAGWARLTGAVHDGAIFGHDGFLEYFTAKFDGKKRELSLKPNSRLPKK